MHFRLNESVIHAMRVEEHIWELAAKKLAREASDDELKELTHLLQTNSVIADVVNMLFDWWELERKLAHKSTSHSLFNRISKTIEKEELKKQNAAKNEQDTVSAKQL